MMEKKTSSSHIKLSSNLNRRHRRFHSDPFYAIYSWRRPLKEKATLQIEEKDRLPTFVLQ